MLQHTRSILHCINIKNSLLLVKLARRTNNLSDLRNITICFSQLLQITLSCIPHSALDSEALLSRSEEGRGKKKKEREGGGKKEQVYVKINRMTHLQAMHSSSSPPASREVRVTGQSHPFCSPATQTRSIVRASEKLARTKRSGPSAGGLNEK